MLPPPRSDSNGQRIAIREQFFSLRKKKSPLAICFSSASENRRSNRYQDAVPFDNNRVLVSRNRKYINASYISGAHSEKEFIATQAPLFNSFASFWEMVLLNNSRVIMMLTELEQDGERKADQYWPTPETQTEEYDGIFVKCLSQTNHQVQQSGPAQPDVLSYRMSELQVQENETQLFVKHVLVHGWGEHGVVKPWCLKKLVELFGVLKTEAEGSSPISVEDASIRLVRPSMVPIIHCSAGLGRTGTLISAIILHDQARSGMQLESTQALVQSLRNQRDGMVQTLEQFQLIFFFREYLIRAEERR